MTGRTGAKGRAQTTTWWNRPRHQIPPEAEARARDIAARLVRLMDTTAIRGEQ